MSLALLSLQEWERALESLRSGKLRKKLPPAGMMEAASAASLSLTPQLVAGALESARATPFVLGDDIAAALVTHMLVVSWLDTGGLHQLRRLPDQIGGVDVVAAVGDSAKYLRYLHAAGRVSLLTYTT